MQLSENIKMTNFHLTFLWIFPYNMGNNDRKGADPGMRKVDHNKQQKRESLLDSAFSLFIDNGFNKTSIADIVKNAGVAKGTFYLYFKDKYDIRNHLIAHKASQVFQTSYLALQKHTYFRSAGKQSESGTPLIQTSELGIFQKLTVLHTERRYSIHSYYL